MLNNASHTNLLSRRGQGSRKKDGANHQHATHGWCALLHPLQFSKPMDFRRLLHFQCPQLCDNEV